MEIWKEGKRKKREWTDCDTIRTTSLRDCYSHNGESHGAAESVFCVFLVCSAVAFVLPMAAVIGWDAPLPQRIRKSRAILIWLA